MPQSASTAPLSGKKVWLTRPEGQADALCVSLQQLGGKVMLLPLLAITAVQPSREDRQKLIDLDRYDLLFYVSSNAATLGLAAIGEWWPQYPAHILNFAVGPTTAAVLEKAGLVVHVPREQMNSEALLAVPQLQHVAGKKALIVRGEGGRETIAQTLRERGVQVDYAQLYRRSMPQYEPAWLQGRLLNCCPDAVVISSLEALDNFKTLVAPLQVAWQRLPLLLASARIEKHARQIGFVHTAVMADATDVAIIEALLNMQDTTPGTPANYD